MKFEKQREALARMDGWESCPRCDSDECAYNVPRDYNDRNNLHRLICGLSDVELEKYRIHLVEITDSYGWNSDRFIKAEPAQIKEALLKAVNLWEDENGD